MKLKIKITGPKVHGVGYRYFLMDMALDLGLQGFNARNRVEDGQQQVIAFVDGDEEAVADLRKVIETTKPQNAEVSKISVSDYEGNVMDIGAYAQVYTAHQLHIAIPILLEIQSNTALTPKILEEIKEEVKDLGDDLGTTLNERMARMERDIAAIKAWTKMP